MDLQRSAVRLDQSTERTLVARLRVGQQHTNLGLVKFSGSHFALTISNSEKRPTSSVDRHEYSPRRILNAHPDVNQPDQRALQHCVRSHALRVGGRTGLDCRRQGEPEAVANSGGWPRPSRNRVRDLQERSQSRAIGRGRGAEDGGSDRRRDLFERASPRNATGRRGARTGRRTDR